MKLRIEAQRILDFDIENRPLTYLGSDWTTAEVTAIACSFGLNEDMHCWLLGKVEPIDMLGEFSLLYDRADIVTGHYIRKHDLPIINGAMLEYGFPPLGPKLTIDTKLDLKPMKDISRSQQSISDMLGTERGKTEMSQAMWRQANRLIDLNATHTRVTTDVRQHQEMRLKLTELGMLNPPRMWSP